MNKRYYINISLKDQILNPGSVVIETRESLKLSISRVINRDNTCIEER